MAQKAFVQEKPYTYRVSLLIPVFNEEKTILFLLNKIKKALIKKNYQMVIVNDGSTDKSLDQIHIFVHLNPHLNIRVVSQKNTGKGGAIRTAIAQASGEILVVQDADLEYDPEDIPALITAFNQGTMVVYGSRNLNLENRKHSSLFFFWGGLLVTFFTNYLFGAKLTDEATGYKLFHASIFEKFDFKHNDFAWEPEITAKILKKKIEIKEVPIKYNPRSKSEGKKISWVDGVKAIWVLLREYLRR